MPGKDGEPQNGTEPVDVKPLATCLLGQAHAASGWDRFTSNYSGCSVEYPTDIFTASQRPDADGATRFTSSLSGANMVVAGGSNGKKASISDIVRTYLEQVEGETITYRRQEKGWAVYSGYRGGLILSQSHSLQDRTAGLCAGAEVSAS